MMLKSALFAAVLAAAAATGTATTASAAPAAAPAVLAGIQSTSDAVEQVRWRRTRTVTRCVGSRRVLMRIDWRGRVVSRHVVGRCWNHHRRDHRRSHHRRWH